MKNKDIYLECNFCRRFKKTDKLWLITLYKRDYLVCDYHRRQKGEGHADNNQKPKEA